LALSVFFFFVGDVVDKRISSRTRHLSHSAENGRATVLSVSRWDILVEVDGQRHLIPIKPDGDKAYWVGQRINYELLYPKYGRQANEIEAAQWKALLGHLPKGAIMEGRVAKRLRNAVMIDFELGKLYRTTADHFLRHARHRCRDRHLPETGERITMTYYGIHPGLGTPILYAWDYGRDTKYGLYDAGYRAHYRGEDGHFVVLPWDR
jgi:hypothetical protein